MRKFASYVVSAALGLASLSAQQPPPTPGQQMTVLYQGSKMAQDAYEQKKTVLQSFFDMDMTPIFYASNNNRSITKYVVKQISDDDIGAVEEESGNSKLAYNISTRDVDVWKSLKGIDFTNLGLSCNVRFVYSQSSVEKSISRDYWTFSSWTLEGIVNGEEFVVNYKVDNRKTLSGEGHLGKKKITVAYEYEKDTDLFAKRRRTVIGDQTYITEFESKNGAYLSYVVTKQ